jgi:hypothetical protein
MLDDWMHRITGQGALFLDDWNLKFESCHVAYKLEVEWIKINLLLNKNLSIRWTFHVTEPWLPPLISCFPVQGCIIDLRTIHRPWRQIVWCMILHSAGIKYKNVPCIITHDGCLINTWTMHRNLKSFPLGGTIVTNIVTVMNSTYQLHHAYNSSHSSI